MVSEKRRTLRQIPYTNPGDMFALGNEALKVKRRMHPMQRRIHAFVCRQKTTQKEVLRVRRLCKGYADNICLGSKAFAGI